MALVRLIARQSYNISIDKFIITSNRAFNPEGMDPDPTQASVSELPSGVYSTPTITPPPVRIRACSSPRRISRR